MIRARKAVRTSGVTANFPLPLTSIRNGVLLLALLLFPTLLLAAENHRQSIEQALQELDDAGMDDSWHFSMTMQQDDELRVIEHDPSREPYLQRRLISVDGKPPGKKQLQTFRDEEKKRIDDKDPDRAGYSYLVDLESLQLVDTQEHQQRYSFRPRIAALEEEAGKLQGHLLLNTDTWKIDEIAISNAQSISPAFSVTLEHYRLVFHFFQDQGARLLHSMKSEARGKLGFLKSFESMVSVSFSDYRPLAPEEQGTPH